MFHSVAYYTLTHSVLCNTNAVLKYKVDRLHPVLSSRRAPHGRREFPCEVAVPVAETENPMVVAPTKPCDRRCADNLERFADLAL